MTLDDYLTLQDETADSFGKRIKRATSTVTRLRLGITKPDWATAIAIVEATGGQVTPNSFIGIEDKPPAEPPQTEAAQ